MKWTTAVPLLAICLAACSSADDEQKPADYPPGPYGSKTGTTIADLQFTTAEGKPLSLHEYYRGQKSALVFLMSATWCTSCQGEITWLNAILEQDAAVGAILIVMENQDLSPASTAEGALYRDAYGPTFPVVVDPERHSDPLRPSTAIPINMVVRTDTMKIEYLESGFQQTDIAAAVAKAQAR